MSTPEPHHANDESGPIAVFDFDGTLVRRDTLIPFLAIVAGPWRVARALGAQSTTYRRNPDAAKADALRRLLTGFTDTELSEMGSDYAVGLHHLLRPDMTERVRWHRREGHRLVIVSASLGYYLRPFAHTLGFDHVIAVEMDIDPSGTLSGELDGPNVRGPEKARRLTDWLDGRPPAEMWAYGDSSGDDELLAMADHAHWLGRRATRNR